MYLLNLISQIICLVPNVLLLLVSLTSLRIYGAELNSYKIRYVICTSSFLFIAIIFNILCYLLFFLYPSSTILEDFYYQFSWVFKFSLPVTLILSILVSIWLIYLNVKKKSESRMFSIFSSFVVCYFFIWQIFGSQIIEVIDKELSILLV